MLYIAEENPLTTQLLGSLILDWLWRDIFVLVCHIGLQNSVSSPNDEVWKTNIAEVSRSLSVQIIKRRQISDVLWVYKAYPMKNRQTARIIKSTESPVCIYIWVCLRISVCMCVCPCKDYSKCMLKLCTFVCVCNCFHTHLMLESNVTIHHESEEVSALLASISIKASLSLLTVGKGELRGKEESPSDYAALSQRCVAVRTLILAHMLELQDVARLKALLHPARNWTWPHPRQRL